MNTAAFVISGLAILLSLVSVLRSRETRRRIEKARARLSEPVGQIDALWRDVDGLHMTARSAELERFERWSAKHKAEQAARHEETKARLLAQHEAAREKGETHLIVSKGEEHFVPKKEHDGR